MLHYPLAEPKEEVKVTSLVNLGLTKQQIHVFCSIYGEFKDLEQHTAICDYRHTSTGLLKPRHLRGWLFICFSVLSSNSWESFLWSNCFGRYLSQSHIIICKKQFDKKPYKDVCQKYLIFSLGYFFVSNTLSACLWDRYFSSTHLLKMNSISKQNVTWDRKINI